MTTTVNDTNSLKIQLDELSKIGESSFKRRITNEVTELSKKCQYLNLEHTTGNQNNFTFTVTVVLEDGGDLYQFVLTNEYPFRPPATVTVNHVNMKKYLQVNSPKTLNELREFYNIRCLCCTSILCYNNWSPSYNLLRFISEFDIIKKMRRCIIYRILIQKISYKYMNDIKDINILEWLL